ncbi:hypothetical protein C0J52_06250 [Blattella germanica]|nr:hypothetical protein C0J52_06250 [Blattella germanica]
MVPFIYWFIFKPKVIKNSIFNYIFRVANVVVNTLRRKLENVLDSDETEFEESEDNHDMPGQHPTAFSVASFAPEEELRAYQASPRAVFLAPSPFSSPALEVESTAMPKLPQL